MIVPHSGVSPQFSRRSSTSFGCSCGTVDDISAISPSSVLGSRSASRSAIIACASRAALVVRLSPSFVPRAKPTLDRLRLPPVLVLPPLLLPIAPGADADAGSP